MKNRFYYRLPLLCGLIGLTAIINGCATIASGTTQSVSVQAIDSQTHQLVSNAKCTITDGRGVVHPINVNPGSSLLTKGSGALNTQCVAKGYQQKVVASGQSFNAWTIGNVIFWPGALVDAATGAIQKYPSHITVTMEKRKHA